MLKRSIIISGGLHVAVIVATTMAWPHVLELTDESPPVVPIDLVEIADVTNIVPTAEEKKPEPPQEVAPPPQAAPPPPPEAEVAPPELDKTPKPKPEVPKPEEQQAAAPPNPVMPRRKPQPDSQKFDVDSVLALLDKSTPKPPPPKPEPAKPDETPRTGIGAQNAMTMDIKDALLAQMRECWNVPVGAPNPEQLIVQVRVFLTPDGSLQQAPQLESATRAAEATNPYMRTAAEAALRAVNVCAPYKRLPKDRYEAWHEIIMTFDPSKMVGR